MPPAVPCIRMSGHADVEFNSLAYCELNFILATLFRPGGADFDLYETDESDVKPVHDVIVPLPKLGTKGVQIIFH